MPSDSKVPGEDGHKRPHKGPRGFQPTDDQRRIVLASKSVGIENSAIAKALGIDRDTLARRFKGELEIAREQLHTHLAGKLVSIAMNDDHKDQQRALQFLLQSQFGYATQQNMNFGVRGGSVPDDAAKPSEDQVLPAKITVEFVNHRPKGLPGAPPEDQ